MDIKRILLEKEGRGMPKDRKNNPSYTTTICLRVVSVFSATRSSCHTELMGEIV